MPNLESELRRFESAKFGADVKDAFVSCVRKIHAENEGYQQLKGVRGWGTLPVSP